MWRNCRGDLSASETVVPVVSSHPGAVGVQKQGGVSPKTANNHSPSRAAARGCQHRSGNLSGMRYLHRIMWQCLHSHPISIYQKVTRPRQNQKPNNYMLKMDLHKERERYLSVEDYVNIWGCFLAPNKERSPFYSRSLANWLGKHRIVTFNSSCLDVCWWMVVNGLTEDGPLPLRPPETR